MSCLSIHNCLLSSSDSLPVPERIVRNIPFENLRVNLAAFIADFFFDDFFKNGKIVVFLA